MPFKYEINGSIYEFETEPTEQELDEVGQQNQEIVKEQKPLQEKQGIIGKVFNVPEASNREAIRANKLLGVTGPFAGSIASTGIAGKKAQLAATAGAQRPSSSETFQEEAIRKSVQPKIDEWSKRTGILSPQTKIGRAVIMAESYNLGLPASVGGYIQDQLTSPAAVLLSLSDIISAAKTVSKTVLQSRKLNTAKEVVGNFRKIIGGKTKGIAKKADILNSNKKIATAIDAVVDNKENLVIKGNIGVLPKNVDEAITAVNQTKQQVLNKYTELRKAAGQGNPEIDLTDVGLEILKQDTKASKIANPKLVQNTVAFADELAANGKISLDDAEEVIRKWNKELETVYKNNSRSLDDVNMASVKATAAKKLRELLDNTVKAETGESYQDLKNIYGSLAEMEEQLSKKVIKMASKSSGSIEELSKKFDSVPIIYGVFTGNLPLTAAGVAQKTGAAI